MRIALCSGKDACSVFKPSILPPQEMSEMLSLHLRCTEMLASHCWQEQILAFKMRPKHHYIWHLAKDVERNHVNPRVCHNFNEESFLGKVKNIAIRCHGKSVQRRTLDRYLIALAIFLK